MACYHPLRAFRCADGSVTFVQLGRHDIIGDLELPCGRCIGCRLERSRQWSMRCINEAALHQANQFVTLTYSDENLPPGNSLQYRDFQLFMKRLRKQYGPVRFYMCGEYGSQTQRPHYHACLFNLNITDKQLHSVSGPNRLYTSPILTKLWPLGHSLIGDLTKQSAAYTARYIIDKITGDLAEQHYEFTDTDGIIHSRTPEFNRMSLRPGIGASWINKYAPDVYPQDKHYHEGRASKPPKSYDRYLKRANPDMLEDIQFTRALTARQHQADNTTARLAIKEQVQKARLARLQRNL